MSLAPPSVQSENEHRKEVTGKLFNTFTFKSSSFFIKLD